MSQHVVRQPSSRSFSPLMASRRAFNGVLPDHYAGSWRAEFDTRLHASLYPGIRILDVGSGRQPTLAPELRPSSCHYVGLDVSRSELERALPGSYDEFLVSDVTHRDVTLENSFDLVVSFQAFEHIYPLAAAIENLHSYLCSGGRLIAQLSGTFSAYGLLNQVSPHRVSVWLVHRLLKRPADEVFPAKYDQCWSGALHRAFSHWSNVEVVPRWLGAPYFAFLRPLLAAYVAYEEWARLGGHDNLAPYYIVDAVR